ncbi:LCP family protein [Streptomyces sp. G-5]|uniref:LCP family protein n=1 Tax=Streptomyces sp. G-5 TaxID=2977231 RepID=UPI0021D29106|nr:LCP family protein [Streptomyces sp. G-5]MCU4748683.1 LCP family protein [Streptomyces sp. G-5]
MPHKSDTPDAPDAAAATEDSATAGGDEEPGEIPGPSRPPGRRRWVRVLRWTAGGLAVALLGTAGAGYLYLRHLNSNLTKEELNLGSKPPLPRATPNAEGQTPINILLLGSDSRGSQANAELGGARDNADRPGLADTQMLIHVSADRGHISALSIPRDTRVTIPECTDPKDGTVYPETERTINTSIQHGGPGCTVATWEELTGIPIDHFMMVEFAGAVSLADAVGGVPVCVADNVHDEDSGLHLEAGTTEVKGEQALQWLRTRHGFEDGSDIGRTKAQQMYFTAMAAELQQGTKLTDPVQLMDLAEAATDALTVDPGLGSVEALYDLGEDVKNVPSDAMTMVTMPWLPDPQRPAAHVIPDAERAERIFSAIRNDVALDDAEGLRAAEEAEAERLAAEAPDPAPAEEITVAVRNGTGTAAIGPVPGRASQVAGALYGEGYTQAYADDTWVTQDATTLGYPAGDPQRLADARAVAEALGLPASAVRESQGTTVLVLTIGADWREGTLYPAPQEEPDADAGDDGAGDAGDRERDDAPEEILREDEAVTGKDENACMTVNPLHIW